MSTDNWELLLNLLPHHTLQTLIMVLSSTFFALILGLPTALVLFLTHQDGLKPCPPLYRFISSLVDIVRSFPFAILIVALIPFTRLIAGTSLGMGASIVPLSIAATPYFARLAEYSFKGISKDLVEACVLIGSTKRQFIGKILLKESMPSLIQNLTLTSINLLSYSAMAGLVGGEGLGKVAIDYGYYRFNTTVMVTTVVVLILLVQLFQYIGNYFSRKILIKRGLIKHA